MVRPFDRYPKPPKYDEPTDLPSIEGAIIRDNRYPDEQPARQDYDPIGQVLETPPPKKRKKRPVGMATAISVSGAS